MEYVYTEAAPKPVGPYSQAVRAGNTLFVSGQIPIDPATGEVVRGGVAEQTRRVLENIRAILEAAGYSLRDVAMVFAYLRDLSRFEEFNRVYEEYFGGHRPARVTVEVSRLPRDVDVEIAVIAVKA